MNMDREPQSSEELDDVLAGLDQLAERLDAQRLPGWAWEVPVGRASQHSSGPRSLRRLVAPLSAVAAVVAIMALGQRWLEPPRPPMEPKPAVPTVVVSTPATDLEHPFDSDFEPFDGIPMTDEPYVYNPFQGDLADGALDEILIVEDLDSYSIIDMTGETLLISFFRKDSEDAPEAIPLISNTAADPNDPT